MKIYVPDQNSALRLADAARRMGVELVPLPSLEEWRRMFLTIGFAGVPATALRAVLMRHDGGDP